MLKTTWNKLCLCSFLIKQCFKDHITQKPEKFNMKLFLEKYRKFHVCNINSHEFYFLLSLKENEPWRIPFIPMTNDITNIKFGPVICIST